jgi:hypothetical protein
MKSTKDKAYEAFEIGEGICIMREDPSLER